MLNIAHRGGSGLRPENTLAAFAFAIECGADGAELDVQLSQDGEVVVFHDYRLKPEICRSQEGDWLARPTPRIKELSLSELRKFDVGRHDPGTAYGRRHFETVRAVDGETIPTLSQVIDVARRAPKPFWLYVELKSSWADRSLSSDPVELADATMEVIRSAKYLEKTVFVGFDWPALLQVKETVPEAKCWFTTIAQSWFREGQPPAEDDPPSEPALQMLRYWAKNGLSPWAGGFDAVRYDGSILNAIKAAGGDGWFPMYRDVSAGLVAQARSLGLKVGAWTVDEVPLMQRMISLGLDAICTDRPDLLAGVSTRKAEA
jgi:glycerophosphoryl diester phosphodiesterase